MSLKVNYSENPAQQGSEKLHMIMREFSDTPILLMLSGGSASKILDDLGINILGSQMTITILDERHNTEETINNFAQLMKTDLYAAAKAAGAAFIDTRVRAARSLSEEAAFFQYKLKKWRDDHVEGKIIATMGLGEDGHTAGIMPFPEDPQKFTGLFEQERIWVVGYDAGNKNKYPERITVTNTFLKTHVDTALLYVSGNEKRGALENMLHISEDKHEVPARIIHDMKNVFIYTDIERVS